MSMHVLQCTCIYLAGIRSKNSYVTGDKIPRITIKLHVLITRISNTLRRVVTLRLNLKSLLQWHGVCFFYTCTLMKLTSGIE